VEKISGAVEEFSRAVEKISGAVEEFSQRSTAFAVEKISGAVEEFSRGPAVQKMAGI
jgi:hypothetical protein